ncbi:MAG: hypothetical protein KF708_08440 [Pirellulales bacterium]|nr:hypothetical protein [Pirellulales bacterium]
MDRCQKSGVRSLLSLLLICSLALSAGGCAAVATAIYIVKGTNVSAEYKGLVGKRVAVVCRPAASLQYGKTAVSKELGQAVSALLRANVRKIVVVPQQDIEEWMDENTWDEFTEVGEAVDADQVVAIELEHFSLYQGQTTYQGRCDVRIAVYDLKQDGDIAYEKIPPEFVYPPNIGMPTFEKAEQQFRREFMAAAARDIAQHFYDHDSRVEFAEDARAFH